MKDTRDSNGLLLRFVLLPTIFLTVALLGGVRVAAETRAFLFNAPPLVALVLAVLLLLLFARGGLLNLPAWLSGDNAPLTNISHALTLLALFFASAQAFNSVLPERGLLRWMFAFFFLWTLWNNQFAAFDARLTLRSLAVLFGTAFIFKHMLLASLYAPDDGGGGWLKRLAAALFEGFTQGTLLGERETFAPATGYLSFFTLALYIGGLILLPAAPDDALLSPLPPGLRVQTLCRDFRQLPPDEQVLVRESILRAGETGFALEVQAEHARSIEVETASDEGGAKAS